MPAPADQGPLPDLIRSAAADTRCRAQSSFIFGPPTMMRWSEITDRERLILMQMHDVLQHRVQLRCTHARQRDAVVVAEVDHRIAMRVAGDE